MQKALGLGSVLPDPKNKNGQTSNPQKNKPPQFAISDIVSVKNLGPTHFSIQNKSFKECGHKEPSNAHPHRVFEARDL